MTTTHAYRTDLYNTQRLLFEHTRRTAEGMSVEVPEDFYDRGWTTVSGIADEHEAVAVQEDLIGSIESTRVPLHDRFGGRVQLGKADQIPVCDDVVATSFQILHFDMGLPLAGEDQLLVTHVGIYLPMETRHPVTARTRLVELGGLLAGRGLSPDAVDAALLAYARAHGDGWDGHNSLRLAALVRFVDALADEPEVSTHIDKTVGQWFMQDQHLDAVSAHAQERAFLARHGIDLGLHEHEIELQPGQLLLLDNLRVVHGRVGRRKAQEIYNFMFGVEAVDAEDVAAVRSDVAQLVTR